MASAYSPHNSTTPREDLITLGAAALSDRALIAILLGSGGKDRSVHDLAEKIVTTIDNSATLTAQRLMEIPGIGVAKASTILAALEFSRRRITGDGNKIREPQDVVPLVAHLADRKQETFLCISLNGAHEVIATRIVTIGLANACQVHPREVFANPITDGACAIIVAHNHPSGDLTPSPEDRHVTERLQSAAKMLGIHFLDHIIFSRRGIYSLCCGGLQHDTSHTREFLQTMSQ